MNRKTPVQLRLRLHDGLLVDNFAGGGGASTGIEWAFGRPVDIAINHDPEAIAMHEANHPHTRHYCQDVFSINPLEATGGKSVALAWFSPDCKHFSKAKGGKPREKKIRDLAWVVIRWGSIVRPEVIMLENVEEFRDWGPLLEDGTPCPLRKGETFEKWRGQLERLGYTVDCRLLRACDYGAPTIRKRLFLVARRDGRSIVWPKPTHGDPKTAAVKSRKLLPWRTAAECIDWDIPCPSIFERKRPLAEATRRRIARGVQRYVIETDEPFIVTYYGAKQGDNGFRGQGIDQPLRTQTTENRHGLIAPSLIPIDNVGQRSGDPAHNIKEPLRTITFENRHALVAAHITTFRNGAIGSAMDAPINTLTAGGTPARQSTGNTMGLCTALLAKHDTGDGGECSDSWRCKKCGFTYSRGDLPTCGCVKCGSGEDPVQVSPSLRGNAVFLAKHYTGVVGSELTEPIGTVTSIDHHSLCAASVIRHFGESVGSSPSEPVGTITAGGMGKTGVIAANLVRHYGKSAGADVDSPAKTITGKSKDSLVASHLIKLRGTCRDGQPISAPMPTVTAGGTHVGEVRASLLMQYHGMSKEHDICAPLNTISTRDRFACVEANLNPAGISEEDRYKAWWVARFIETYGQPAKGTKGHAIYPRPAFLTTKAGDIIIDLGMRMLIPRELFRAQGFPDSYIIDLDINGRKLPKSAQVRMCGNSVSPPPAIALIQANIEEAAKRAAA